jgi:hypothetical protein
VDALIGGSSYTGTCSLIATSYCCVATLPAPPAPPGENDRQMMAARLGARSGARRVARGL